MTRRLIWIVSILLAVTLSRGVSYASAASGPLVNVVIDISDQSMSVDVDGSPYAQWSVSTAREGYHTPRGAFRPTMLRPIWFSKKYDNSPMPNSVFFHYGFAIHGTYSERYLGRPASHGCVRLSLAHAAEFYSLVQRYGMRATRIRIVD